VHSIPRIGRTQCEKLAKHHLVSRFFFPLSRPHFLLFFSHLWRLHHFRPPWNIFPATSRTPLAFFTSGQARLLFLLPLWNLPHNHLHAEILHANGNFSLNLVGWTISSLTKKKIQKMKNSKKNSKILSIFFYFLACLSTNFT